MRAELFRSHAAFGRPQRASQPVPIQAPRKYGPSNYSWQLGPANFVAPSDNPPSEVGGRPAKVSHSKYR